MMVFFAEPLEHMTPLVDQHLLRTLVPLSSLTGENLQTLASETMIEQLQPGEHLFKQGDSDTWSFYLLSGELVLASADSKTTLSIFGGTQSAKHSIAQHQPRQVTATGKTQVAYIRIDTQQLDRLLTWDQQVAGYEISELDGNGDTSWLNRLPQAKPFLGLPSANIQTLLSLLQTVPVEAGQPVVRQGEPGDSVYIIKQGRCQASHQAPGGESVVLAELTAGDCFGEEALLSESPRNATVSLTTDGTVLRLGKREFVQLLKEPPLKWVDYPQAVAMVTSGAELLDVRLEKEHQNGNIMGSTNIPLSLVRSKADTLDPSRTYLVYCDTGRRSAAAAHLLEQRGIDAHVLRGGLSAIPKQAPAKV